MIVSFKTAKLSKEVGFDKDCNSYYESSAKVVSQRLKDNWNQFQLVSAPTQEELHKWVRENRNILISVYRSACGYMWSMMKNDSGTDLGYSDERGDCQMSGTFTTHEKAYEDALYLSLLAEVEDFRGRGYHYSGFAAFVAAEEE